MTTSISKPVDVMSAEDTTAARRDCLHLPGMTAILAFLVCNSFGTLAAMLASLGIAVEITTHLHAAVISLLVISTAALVTLRLRGLRRYGTACLAVTGAILVVGTMYVAFDKTVETLGLMALLAAAASVSVTARSPSRLIVESQMRRENYKSSRSQVQLYGLTSSPGTQTQ